MEKTILQRTTVAMVVVLVMVVVLFGVLRNTVISKEKGSEAVQIQEDGKLSPEAARGALLYKDKGCAHCHLTDSTEIGMAPGLKGLFKRKSLPVVGKPATEDNVRDQLTKPYKNMPSFAGRLNDKEMDEIIAYLKTL
jgi:cytochrome c2